MSSRVEIAILGAALAVGCGSTPAGRGSPAAPATVAEAAREGPVEGPTDDARDEAPTNPETWPVTLLRNEGVWSFAAPPPSDTVHLLVHATQPQRGYDPMGTQHLVEARARGDLALRWRVLLPGNASAIASSDDGAQLVVQLADRTRVLDASDGHTVRDVAGGAYLVACGESGEIHTQSPVLVRALASSGGVLAIGAGDTTIRLFDLGATTPVERRLTRTDVRTIPGDAVAPVALRFRDPGELERGRWRGSSRREWRRSCAAS